MNYAIKPSVPEEITKNIKANKSVEQLLGICNGLIADQQLNNEEIDYLNLWIKQHPEANQQWPGTVIAERIQTILADGIVTTDERTDLLAFLKDICGNDYHETGSTDDSDGSSIPFDRGPIAFAGQNFCLTGTFATSSRANAAKKIIALGGTIHDRIKPYNENQYTNFCTNYLVIGTGGSQRWVHGSYGRKIEEAIELKEQNKPIKIISEKQYFTAMLAADN